MDLNDRVVTHKALKVYDGEDSIDLAEGKYLQVRTGTGANFDEHLLEQVPAGKKWHIVVQVYISETDKE